MAIDSGEAVSPPTDADAFEVPHVVPLGSFPFPPRAGGSESRQLAWIRNHANYLAARGWLDYVRAISIILRGVVVNMLIGLPVIIIAALFVALLSVNDWGFGAAFAFVLATLGWIVLAPVLTRLWSIFRLENTLALGTSSSVKTRDRFERSFGAFLIITVSAALIEGMSFLLDDFHFWISESNWGGREIASIGSFTAGLFAATGRLLPKLGGKARSAAILIVGLIGVLVPLLLIMFMANFLAFGGPTAQMTFLVAVAGLILSIILAFGFIVVLWTGAFGLRDNIVALVVLAVAFLTFGGFAIAADNAVEDDAEIQTQLAVLDLTRTTKNRTLANDLVDRAPVEIDLIAEFAEYSSAFDLGLNPESLPQITPRYSDLSDDELFYAERVDIALSELYRQGSYLPGVSNLVAQISQGGFSDDGLNIDSDELEGLYIELDLLTSRVRDLSTIFGGETEPTDLLSKVIATPLARPSEFEFESVQWERLGDDLIEQSDELFAEGDALIELGEQLLAESDSDPESTADPFLGFDLIDIGYDRVDRAIQLNEEGTIMSLGEEPIYLSSYFFAAPGLPPSPAGVPITSREFPLLAERFPFDFSGISWDLFFLETDFLNAREAIARQAVFSGRLASTIDNPAVGDIRRDSLRSSAIFALMLAVVLWAYGWLAVDPNRTSLHGMYRDRLASAFLVGVDTKGDVDVESDLDLHELSRYDAGSTAPYHIINTALNLQASKDISIHDRASDFFIFSKRFIGGERTGYCRSDTMERAFPDMSLSTAMAISAAAASPNMGRSTQPALVAFMTMLNVRLGYWMPNPGLLEARIGLKPKPASDKYPANTPGKPPPGFNVKEVIKAEESELKRRWQEQGSDRKLDGGLVGLAFSGGGIRSATLNLGLVQTLYAAGIFDHVDYMSTVSGGGYLGSSISSAMRSGEATRAQVSSKEVETDHNADGKQVVKTPAIKHKRKAKRGAAQVQPQTTFKFNSDAVLNIADQRVHAGQRLLKMGDPDVLEANPELVENITSPWWRPGGGGGSFGEQFGWRVRPTALLREITGRLNEKSKSVNVSDGGHIENLAVVELLRRKCRYIIVGDGGMDIDHSFGALAILIRTARVELETDIDIRLDPLRLKADGFTPEHWVMGTITYPKGETGYLLYCKSSLTGNEPEDVLGYRKSVPKFPHESTADQFFDEGQFESYRVLGQHIGESVLEHLNRDGKASYAELKQWFKDLHAHQTAAAQAVKAKA